MYICILFRPGSGWLINVGIWIELCILICTFGIQARSRLKGNTMFSVCYHGNVYIAPFLSLIVGITYRSVTLLFLFPDISACSVPPWPDSPGDCSPTASAAPFSRLLVPRCSPVICQLFQCIVLCVEQNLPSVVGAPTFPALTLSSFPSYA
jgi:hypothetical protein